MYVCGTDDLPHVSELCDDIVRGRVERLATRMSRLATNSLRFSSNETNIGLFKISFSTFWLGEPFDANLTHPGPKSDIPDMRLGGTELCRYIRQGPNWAKLSPNGRNTGIFKSSGQYVSLPNKRIGK